LARRSKKTEVGDRAQATIVVNGWAIYAHPLFLDALEALREQVTKARAKSPATYRQCRPAKMLAAVLKLALVEIPADPAADQYRQGASLGATRKHWFRAKFYQQYRLFFRFDTSSRVIVLAWVNDDDTRRAYGAKTDAYAVFRKMLDRGNPPDDWTALMEAASAMPPRS